MPTRQTLHGTYDELAAEFQRLVDDHVSRNARRRSPLADALHRVWAEFRPLQREAMHASLEARTSSSSHRRREVAVFSAAPAVVDAGSDRPVMWNAAALRWWISPLISDERSGRRPARRRRRGGALNSTLLPHDETTCWRACGSRRLLYVSPERIACDGSQGLRRMLQQAGVVHRHRRSALHQ
jgi:hypothetical protein